MVTNTVSIDSTNTLSFSTDEICRGTDTTRCLSDDLDTIETNIAALQTGKANSNHTHSGYLLEDDAVAAFAPMSHTHAAYLAEDDAVATFAPINHTHPAYLSGDDAVAVFAPLNHTHSDKADANHTHADINTAIETLNTGKAASSHTHAQSDITGLADKLDDIDEAIAALQEATSVEEIEPMLVASMYLGKLDNNNGAENTSSTRICSEPFAIQNGKSYWQVNDKAVAMYVLIYDADEVFVAYLGSFDSGAEIAVNNANAAYMRLGSKLGEYDLTNEFRIYDVDPSSTSGSPSTVDAYTKTESDARYATISHSHTGFAAESHTHSELHTHSNQTVLDGITADKVAAWDAGTGSTTPAVDAYTKTESDAKYALVGHSHANYMTEDDVVDAFAPLTHTHTGYLTEDDAADFAPATHSHSEYMSSTAAGNTFAPLVHEHAGYAAQTHTHSYNDLTDTPSTQTYTHPDTHPPSMITGLATVATSGSYSDLSNKPTSMPANGGDADTVGGKYPSAFANVSHSHSDYLPLAGGSLTGNLNVGGILRVNNQQSVYDSGTMITLSTNNRQTMIAGSAIYSKQTIQVSSDERLKENVEYADPDDCLAFINDLEVKTFNYIGDDGPCIGVIAQDLQGSEFEKFFVSVQPGEEGYLAVKAADLVFPLIAAVQNLSAEIDYLKAKIY